MRFFRRQREARQQTRHLLLIFGLTLGLLLLAVNAALALAWGLTWAWWRPGPLTYPGYFFEVNTAITLLFVLGGWWLETSSLAGRGGSERLARRLGARELRPTTDHAEHRLQNIVQEMAISSGLRVPTVMLVPRVTAINAFATGWDEHDAIVAVTEGALDLLNREELQGLVAHEMSHIREGDTRLNMRLAGMVFGLELIYQLGQRMWQADDEGNRSPWAILGLAVMLTGWLGWLAGHGLQAAVSRQREYLADARAVQWTRSRDGLGQVLRKVLDQQTRGEAGLGHWARSSLQHLLLVTDEDDAVGHWLDSHPPLQQRIRRIYGRGMGPMAARGAEPPTGAFS